ncbi:hypothetical protein [Apilactobacillus ozensis]|uniref:hypothetical protein n=1 Tax=Apilactobacillus ozensis TaxID=866801 RepID=UPI002009E895|nr:hypothetical protein [Apilactobacillus ozensis]MCK8606946.1 hypothetical protein [Apilactobacillus ozensis]
MHLKLKNYLIHSYINITFWVFLYFLLIFWILPITIHIFTGSFSFSEIFTGISSDFITISLGISLVINTLFNNTNFRFAISNGISRKSYWKTRMVLLFSFVLISEIIHFALQLIEKPYVFSGGDNFIPYNIYSDFSLYSYFNNPFFNFFMAFFISILLNLFSTFFFMALNNFYLMFTKKVRRILIFVIVALIFAIPFMIGFLIAYLQYVGGNELIISIGKFVLSIFGINVAKHGIYFNPLLFAFDVFIIDLILAFLSYKFNSKIQIYKD